MNEPKARAPKIAVIAIHGVGDHQPFEMGRATANLLANMRDGAGPVYCAFGEQYVRIPVEPLKAPPWPLEDKQESWSWGPLDAVLSDRASGTNATAGLAIDEAFMQGQLAKYTDRDPQATYDCLRLEGERSCGNSKAKVHIYDMTWSDLSGVGKGFVSILSELYQLLFHLTSIGVNNIKAARIALLNTKNLRRPWALFDQIHTLAAAALAWPIALFNLILLTLAIPVVGASLARHLDAQTEAVVAGIILALDLVAAVFVLLRYRKRLAVCLLVLAVAALAGAYMWVSGQRDEWADCVITVELLAAAFGISFYFVSAYERRRPGSMAAYLTCWPIIFAISGALFWSARAYQNGRPAFFAIRIFLRFAEATLIALLSSWIILGALAVTSFAAGLVAVLSSRHVDGNRAARVFWTARLTLSLPTLLFLVVTMVFWTGFVFAAAKIFPLNASQALNEPCSPVPPGTLCFAPVFLGDGKAYPLAHIAVAALSKSGVLYLALAFVAMSIAALLGAWTFLPSVFTEYRSPDPVKAGDDSTALGNWLTRSYAGPLRFAGELLYVVVLLFAPAIVFAVGFTHGDVPTQLMTVGNDFALTLGTLVMGAGITVMTLGGRVAKLAGGLRPVLRVALDVDNWLREHPRDSNPTARISARYVSLLRFISQWRDADGCRYDGLVIFAHSQGTVITSDLLRFLNRSRVDAALDHFYKMPVSLLTCGCPLRQLYELRFPYLYDYGQHPTPADFGLQLWTNAYRSGDYIGRFLWNDPNPWAPLPAALAGNWAPWNRAVLPQQGHDQFCIGAGGHVHYWDRTAPAMAKALDQLIAIVPAKEKCDAQAAGDSGNRAVS